MSQSSSAGTQLHVWRIPTSGDEYELAANAGSVAVVLGPNGSGKSALGVWLVGNASARVVQRIAAHRQVWLSSSAPNLTVADRIQSAPYHQNLDMQAESRWRDEVAQSRTAAILLDLTTAENHHNSKIAQAVEIGLDWSSIGERPLKRLNRILEAAQFDGEIAVAESGEIMTTNRSGDTYPLAKMSDGEKSAMLLTAGILTAKENSIIVIDEPERHIHRAISSKLIRSAIRERQDCAYVILTHDLGLANDLRLDGARTLVTTKCHWEAEAIAHWDLHPVPAESELPEGVIQAILGARTMTLFCEGVTGGLDHRLYAALYPQWNVLPVGSCENVIRAVAGLRDRGAFAWIEARGVIDADWRSPEEVSSLRGRGLWVSRAHEIENILYLPDCQRRVAETQAAATGCSAEDLISAARVAAISLLRQVQTRQYILAQAQLQRVKADLRNQVESLSLPLDETVRISIASTMTKELEQRYDGHLQQMDQRAFMLEFPIRESGVRVAVAKALECPDAKNYQNRVLRLAEQDAELAAALRALISEIELAETAP